MNETLNFLKSARHDTPCEWVEMDKAIDSLESDMKEIELLATTGINGTCKDATLALKQIRAMIKGY